MLSSCFVSSVSWLMVRDYLPCKKPSTYSAWSRVICVKNLPIGFAVIAAIVTMQRLVQALTVKASIAG